MTSSFLPPQIAGWVAATMRARPQVHRITPDKVDIYVQSPPEFFNEVVGDHLALRHAQYGFCAPEHSDWVCPAYCLKGGARPNPGRMFPLNSWVLKSPVDAVPTCEQIGEEYEWCFDLVRACASTPMVLLSPDQLHEHYVRQACEQVIDHVKMLSLWSEAGRPREQQDCFTGMERKRVKKILELQRLNELDAREKLDLFRKHYAPSSVVDRLRASCAREQAICDQLSESMRYC